MKRKLSLSILLVLLLVCSIVLFASCKPTKNDKPKVDTTKKTEITTTPDNTTEPDVTTEPDSTTVGTVTPPESTVVPDVTDKPDNTTAPDVTTEEPDDTTVPDVTTAPDNTTEPDVTTEPDSTTVGTVTPPESTVVPDSTTVTPDGTTVPDSTTKEPDITTEKPDGTTTVPDSTTKEPDVTTAPDNTTEPPGSTSCEHEYGPMYYELPPTFWDDGNIAYYQCGKCGKYFDIDYAECENVTIPKLSTDLSICVNGDPTPLKLEEQDDGHVIWSLEGLAVKKGDVITIIQTGSPEISYKYFADGNVSDEDLILTTASAANVLLYATPNGLMLSIDGYKYEGLVIEINGVQYPMIYTSYPDETTTYIYGYVNFAVGDEFVIVDNVSGTVYDYDDLYEEYLWDVWDFHRGDNGEFVIDYACRYGIEFDYGGNKEIYINKTFAPLDGSSYEITFENTDAESVELMQMQFEAGSEAYEDLMWYYNHEDVVNKEDIVSYIDENGLYVYIVKLQLEEGTKFNIKNLTANVTVNAEHLSEVYTESGCVTKDGDYVKILKGGYYSIVYIPCFNSFMIEAAESPADVYMYLDGEFIPLPKDENGVVTYKGLVADAYANIMFTDAVYSYLPITLDSQTNSSIAHVFEYGGMSMLYFDKAGTYDLAYNMETGVLSITSEGGDNTEGGDTESDTSNYLYYLSVSGGSGGTQTLTMQVNPTNSKEVCYKGVELTASCFIGVIEMSKDASSSATYGAIADTDSSIAQSFGTVAMIKLAGTYDIYFDTATKTIKIVKAT